MTSAEAVNWIINISADIGKAQHSDLWHYEQALSEIRDMLETQPERKKGHWIRIAPRHYKCSECGVRANSSFANFCHRCGSDMRGEKDE